MIILFFRSIIHSGTTKMDMLATRHLDTVDKNYTLLSVSGTGVSAMTVFRLGAPARNNSALHLSPWLMVSLSAILGLAVAILAVRNAQREKDHMSQNLMDRAAALIWTLEASTRTMTGVTGGSQDFQALLEETAKQSKTAYIAVTDPDGRVLVHSDKSKIGTILYNFADMSSLNVSDIQKWKTIATPEKEQFFEVYSNFTSLPWLSHNTWHTSLGNCTDCDMDIQLPQRSGVGNDARIGRPVIFVGMDVKPFEDALAEDYRNTALIALLVGLLGFGGFISLFWAQNYRLSQQMLQDTKTFASEVVTNLPVGLLTTDETGNVTLINDKAFVMLGIDNEQPVINSIHNHGGIDWDAMIETLTLNKVILEQEKTLVAANGDTTTVSLTASKIVNQHGLFLGHLFILRDIGEIKLLQEQVRRNERLTALGHLAAGIAHEIRNPLSSIRGFATYLAGKFTNEGPEGEAATIMIQEVDRLNRVVSELLEFARPSGMKLQAEDANRVIERTLCLAASDASAKGVLMRFVPNDALPLIPLDAERFTQALLNLLLNGIQATSAGGSLDVSVSVERESSRLAVCVADTGKGMPPEELSGIFNPYFTTKPSGTGLGLAIVHRIVEGHGGKIKVESTPDIGTVFTILLPLGEHE